MRGDAFITEMRALGIEIDRIQPRDDVLLRLIHQLYEEREAIQKRLSYLEDQIQDLRGFQ